MIVIGVDTHKGSHALSAVDDGTGRVRGSREIKADDAGHLAAVRWARGLDEERVWAIEDCRHVSRRLEQALLAAGERVIRVPPKMMGASRRGERERGKSDEIDAQAVARAVVKDGVERFPTAYLDERAMEIRLLSDHREDLVRERTRMQNRLRWHLLELCPEIERRLPRGALSDLRQLERLDRRLRRIAPSARLRIAREELAHTRALTRQTKQLERELLDLIRAYQPALLAEQGCGTLTAALLIGRTAGAERFRSDACFGRQSGTAPIPCSSGQRTQHRLDRGGDRQLNRALHTIAITRAHHDPATKDYLARKEAEGKTKKGALRCLKRYLARRFWRLLTEPPLEPEQAGTCEHPAEPPAIPARPAPWREVDRTITGPVPMICVT
ncbi:MAG: IS110 family transposase [Solirubrobacteraceae bacterium]